jgi:hypothetical protein
MMRAILDLGAVNENCFSAGRMDGSLSASATLDHALLETGSTDADGNRFTGCLERGDKISARKPLRLRLLKTHPQFGMDFLECGEPLLLPFNSYAPQLPRSLSPLYTRYMSAIYPPYLGIGRISDGHATLIQRTSWGMDLNA